MLVFFSLIKCSASSVFVSLLSRIRSYLLQLTVPPAAPAGYKCSYVTLYQWFNLFGPLFPHLDCL